MVKYEFMRAHGKGSEGNEKRGGAIKKGGAKNRGVHAAQAPPLVYATDEPVCRMVGQSVAWLVGRSLFPHCRRAVSLPCIFLNTI